MSIVSCHSILVSIQEPNDHVAYDAGEANDHGTADNKENVTYNGVNDYDSGHDINTEGFVSRDDGGSDDTAVATC